MKVPMILRWALAWAALTGHYISISIGVEPGSGSAYRFVVERNAIQPWLKRRDRINAKKGEADG